MGYKIGICDDEMSVCSELETLVLEYCRINDVAADCEIWTTGEGFISDLKKGIVLDVLFLDIEIPVKNGVEIGNYIREDLGNQTMQIIYISAKTNYAMELFHIHPYDFLVKPFPKKVLFETLDRILQAGELNRKRYRISVRGRERIVAFGSIYYVASYDKHVKVYLNDGEVISLTGKLREEIKKFPAYFVRINQSYAVNLNYVKSYRYKELTLTNGVTLPVSSPYRSELKNRLISHMEDNG